MMLECSTGELLARAALMHHDDQGYHALRYHAVLKGLRTKYLTSAAIVHHADLTGVYPDRTAGMMHIHICM